jgi:hypothetical protein
MATIAQADRKATNLQRKLARKYPELLVIVYPQQGDLVIKATCDALPTLEARDWLDEDLIAADLFRIACSVIDRALKVVKDAAQRDAEWLEACQRMEH